MTCAKTQVTCRLTTPGGVTVEGSNWCRFPQAACPREPGADYAKCRSVCGQGGHAELDALRVARERGVDLFGATASMRGHTYFCMDCQHALFAAGVHFLARP